MSQISIFSPFKTNLIVFFITCIKLMCCSPQKLSKIGRTWATTVCWIVVIPYLNNDPNLKGISITLLFMPSLLWRCWHFLKKLQDSSDSRWVLFLSLTVNIGTVLVRAYGLNRHLMVDLCFSEFSNTLYNSAGFDWESNTCSMWNLAFSSWLDNP